jgi:hypothetical protein
MTSNSVLAPPPRTSLRELLLPLGLVRLLRCHNLFESAPPARRPTPAATRVITRESTIQPLVLLQDGKPSQPNIKQLSHTLHHSPRPPLPFLFRIRQTSTSRPPPPEAPL